MGKRSNLISSVGQINVVAYPPKRAWWAFWAPRRPFLLLRDVEYRVEAGGESVEVFRPRRGWSYRVAFITSA